MFKSLASNVIRFDKWYDNLEDTPRFLFFLCAVAIPFSASMAYPRFIMSQIWMVLVIGWCIYRMGLRRIGKKG